VSDDGEKTFYDVADEIVSSVYPAYSASGEALVKKIAEALEAAYIKGEHQMIDMIRMELNKHDLRRA
jgi:hypothetical protein